MLPDLVLLWATLVALAVAGCGAVPAEDQSRPVVVADDTPRGDETQATDDGSSMQAAEEESRPAPAPRPPIDPATIHGYVRGIAAPGVPRGSGQVAAIRLVVNPHVPTATDMRFEIREGPHAHAFHVVVPNDFPHPLVQGEQVTFDAGFAGGGPNGRATILIEAADGKLLMAVDRLPDGWTVESGRRVSSENLGTYREHHLAVSFAIAGVHATVPPGDWAKITTPDGEYLVWGSAAERQLRAGRPAPPDYVGGWCDFAIVRVR